MLSASEINKLSGKTTNIRNFCLLAHVDHGKTTLSDFLIASNGILSTSLAGQVRFMDSRPDEQIRLITMKASSIALKHTHSKSKEVYMLNLVDAPGHIDFSSEVSTAIRLCDGAIIVVDAVDGVTAQTMQLLREAFNQNLSMILVINKMDLLITRLQMTASEAYYKIRSIIEECNASLAAYVNQLEIAGTSLDRYHYPEDNMWFEPSRGNTMFCSCFDKWAFSVHTMAPLFAEKLGMDVEVMKTALWGEHYLDVKNKKVAGKPLKSTQEPMAIQLLFAPIWELYRCFSEDEYEVERCQAIGKKLGVNEKKWNLPGKEPRTKLQLLAGDWIPVAQCVLDSIVDHHWSPVASQSWRVKWFFSKDTEVPPKLLTDLESCKNNSEAPTVAFVSKLVDVQHMAGVSLAYERPESFDQSFICFTRVFSGRLRLGQKVFVKSGGAVEERTIEFLYLLRGNGLESVDAVNSGCLCGIGGFASLIAKHGTITTDPELPPLVPVDLMSTSIVRVSVDAADPEKLPNLITGLRLLNQVDPQVEIAVLPTGQQILCCAGEVHMERCIKDLREVFAGIDLCVSDPIHSFRETIVKTEQKIAAKTVSAGGVTVSVKVVPFPDEVLELLKKDKQNRLHDEYIAEIQKCIENLPAKTWPYCRKILQVGPRKFGYCGAGLFLDSELSADAEETIKIVLDSIKSGFQIAASSGPIAEEPLHGVAVILSDITLGVAAEDLSLATGSIISVIKDGVRSSIEEQSRRLVEPVFFCSVFSAGTTQGKIYALLNRRRAQILEEIPHEGSDLFHIDCHLPVCESFGLQDELRIATHGAGSAQLLMSHWEIIESDPYFQPTTREEIEDFGSKITVQNTAAKLVERIRRRKGIHKENVVEDGEKQKFSLRGA